MKKLYRTTLFAGVLAFGLSACGDDVQVVDPPDPPPPPPPTLTVSFSPQSVSVNEGQSADLGLNISGGAQGATASWSCTIGDSDVATASETGSGCRVTGVAEGSTTVTAEVTKGQQTASASAGVSVAELQRAEVSISSINQGQTGLPADINNAFGQLDVVINMNPGDESPTQLDLLVDGEVVASQVFSAEEIAAIVEAAAEAEDPAEQVQQITLSFNTARYDIVDGEANIWHLNGEHEISAELQVSQQTAEPRASNVITVRFNNDDGFHVIGTRPTNSAMDEDGLRWFGGPDSGDTEALVVPVIYSVLNGEQRSLQSVTAAFCNETAVTIESEDSPYAFAWECDDYEGPTAGEEPTITSQYAPDGDTGPSSGDDDILNEDEDDYRFPVRVDNLAPQDDGTVFSIVRQEGLDNVNNWLNHQYAFSNGFLYGNLFDNGVGKVDDGDEQYQVLAEDEDGDELVAPTVALTGAGIADALGEDAESVTNEDYHARVLVCDRLDNCLFYSQEVDPAGDHPLLTFGYDETAPGLEFITDDMGVFEDARVIVDEFTTDDDISLVGTDVAAGFAPVASGLSFQRALTQVGSTFDAPESPTVAVFGVGDDPVDMPFTTLDVNGIVSTLESLAETPGLAPDEGFALAAQTTIEYNWSIGDYIEANAGTDPNYYIYQVRLRDQAGNTTMGDRAAYHNNLARPEIEALTRSGSFPADPAFRVTFTQDPLELFEGSMAIQYPNTGVDGVVVWERPGAEISSVLRLDAGIEDGVAFNDYIQRPHRDLMLDLQFADLGLPFLKNIQATDDTDGSTLATGVDNSKPIGAEAQVYNGLPLVETGTVHGTTENGQSDLVTVGIPPEEVPDFSVDYHADTDIQSWTVVDTDAADCDASYCARLVGPSGTFTLPFAAVVIVWADATAPTVWRVAEVATPNFSGEFPTRDDGVDRLYEWHFNGSIEGSAGGDIIFRALGVNSDGDGLLSDELTEAAPVPVQTRINPTPPELDPDTTAVVSITEGTSDDFTVTLETSADGGMTWTPVEGEDVTFSSSGLNGNFDESPPVVTSDVNGAATITFFGNGVSTGTITATWGSHSVTWDVEIVL